MKRFLEALKYILTFIIIFIICLSAYSTNWAINNFSFGSFDEILFQLTSPLIGTSHELISSFLNNSLLVSLYLTIFIFLIYILGFKYLSCRSLEFNIKWFKRKYDIVVNTKVLKTIIVCLSIFIYSLIIYNCLDKIHFISYIKNINNASSFIEDNYVSPKDVKLTFPDKKRNLIYIFAESLESTFFSKDLGGKSPNNYLEPLNKLTESSVNFSNNDKLGGAHSAPGTTWTSAAIVAHTAGTPLKMNFNSINLNKLKDNYKLKGIYALGDI